MKNLIRSFALSLFLTATLLLAQDGPLSNGYIYAYAGNGIESYSGDGGPAINAELALISGATLDAAGNFYFIDSDYGPRIRKVDAKTGIITTVAGTGVEGNTGDGGPATSAEFRLPESLVSDAMGNLYIGDWENQNVRRVDAATGIITTFKQCAESVYDVDGGSAADDCLLYPSDVAMDAAGNLYVTDGYPNSDIGYIKKVNISTGIVTIYAEESGAMAFDASGNLYIAENDLIRKMNATTGIITTIAGNGTKGYSGDGGPATSAELEWAGQPVVDTAGNLYFGDTGTSVVRHTDRHLLREA